MKNLFLFFLLFFFVSAVSAQTDTAGNQSNVVINKKKWSFRAYPRFNNDINSDIFGVFDQQRQYEKDYREAVEYNRSRQAQGLPPAPLPNHPTPSLTSGSLGKIFSTNGYYLYEINITNHSQKTISSITWDYTFFDIDKNQEAGRREFITTTKILPVKSKTLSEKSKIYPTTTVDASQEGKKFDAKYSEKIFIKRIEYSDGSAWNAPTN
ncbi:MAG: hypothetical protein M3033_16040 [Acidobacteriota bacterium]|nr:hypothetical protein [Acidobacteriota bacterium]